MAEKSKPDRFGGRFVTKGNPFVKEAKEIDKVHGNKSDRDKSGWYESTDNSEFVEYDFETGDWQ